MQELVDKGYMSAREYQQLHLWQSGEKAIFGNAKRLTDVLSATALQKIAEEDTELYTKVCEQIEEVYGDTINNA